MTDTIYEEGRLNLPSVVTPEWFAGFTDGEGCFLITRARPCPVFQIKLRWDDGPILEKINRDLLHGSGSIVFCSCANARSGKKGPRANRQDQVQLRCWSRASTARVKCIFDKYPLMSKKARDFQVWRAALSVYNQVKRGPTRVSVDDMQERDRVLGNLNRLLKMVRENLVDDFDLPRLIEEVGAGHWDNQLDLIA